jgi:hypothetical protein
MNCVVQTSANITARRCAACDCSISLEHYFQHRSITLYRCDACHSLVAWPRPTLGEQTALHDNPDYYEHPYFERRRGLTAAVERRCRAAFACIGKCVDLTYARRRMTFYIYRRDLVQAAGISAEPFFPQPIDP